KRNLTNAFKRARRVPRLARPPATSQRMRFAHGGGRGERIHPALRGFGILGVKSCPMELFWVIASAGALLIRAGVALYATGMPRSKNSAATLMRHLCDLCVGVIAFWAVGYAIASSDARVFSVNFKALLGLANPQNIAPYYATAAMLI